jgi:hypothetical protein
LQRIHFQVISRAFQVGCRAGSCRDPAAVRHERSFGDRVIRLPGERKTFAGVARTSDIFMVSQSAAAEVSSALIRS